MDSATNSGTLSTHSCVFVCFIMLWPPARLRLWLQTWTPPSHPLTSHFGELSDCRRRESPKISGTTWKLFKETRLPPVTPLPPTSSQGLGAGSARKSAPHGLRALSSFRQLRLFGAFNSLEHPRHPSSRHEMWLRRKGYEPMFIIAGNSNSVRLLAAIKDKQKYVLEMRWCHCRQRQLLLCRMTLPTFADVLPGFSGSVSSPAAATVTRWQLLFMDNNPHVEKTK